MFARRRHYDVFADQRQFGARKPRPVMRFFAMVLAVAIAGCVLTLGFFGLRPPLLFFPDTVISHWPHDLAPPLDYEQVELVTADEVSIAGWWVPAANEDAPTIVFFHGAMGDLGDRLAWMRLAHNGGFHVLAVDYRGYGSSDGVPSVAGLYRDAEAAYAWVTQTKSIPAHKLIIFGRSLGAAVAAHLAQNKPAALVVLESPFPRMTAIGRTLFARHDGTNIPQFLIHVMYWNANLDTIGRVREIAAPVLVMHSRDDQLVPFSWAEQIVAAAGDNGAISEVRGDHNTVVDATGEAYFVPVRAAFELSRRQP